MSQVVVHRRAAGYLRRLPSAQKEKFKKLLKKLEQDPSNIPDVKQMAGEWTGYRRVHLGNLRVIFWWNEPEDVVYVDHLGPRGDVYK